MRTPSMMRLLLLSLSLLPAASQAVERCQFKGKPINLDNGSSTAKLTGTVRCVDEDTKQETHTVSFRDGKQDGWEIRRWSDGRSVEQEYRAGKRHGGFKRFEEGRLVESTQYADDNTRGESLRYHPNGKVSRRTDEQPEDAKSTYANYDESGRLTGAGCGLRSSREAGLKDCPWKGPSPLVFFHPTGQKRAVIPLKNGLREGLTEVFDAQGERTVSTPFVAGVREGVTTVYRAGKVRRTTTYVQDKVEGDETEFFDDGTKKQVITRKGREELRRVEYFQNGERKRDFVVKDGRAVDSTFNDDGSLSQRQHQRLGHGYGYGGWVPDGLTESFLPDGGPERREHFVEGDADGQRQVWADNGVLVEDSQWKKGRVTARKRWNPDGGLTEDAEFHEDGSRKKKP